MIIYLPLLPVLLLQLLEQLQLLHGDLLRQRIVVGLQWNEKYLCQLTLKRRVSQLCIAKIAKNMNSDTLSNHMLEKR